MCTIQGPPSFSTKKTKPILFGVPSTLQQLSTDQLEIIENLKKSDQIYIVPPRCLDDYYWMLSSVSDQTTSHQNNELEVVPPNDDKKWPGARPILITNDQMRDHKLELLEPRLFRRWVSSHIVNYSFPPYIDNHAEEREITFKTADFFSHEIQGNPPFISKEGATGTTTAWHIPITDWEKDDRFCIRIPKLSDEVSALGNEFTQL